MTQVSSEHLGESLGTDFFSVREQFTDEQWDHFITVRRFVDEEVVPVVGPYWERAEICWPLVRRLPELGIVGEDIKGYGCAAMSPMACGLVTMELHRGDGSLGVFLGVHAGLAMLSVAMCGSEEQKARWLPDMARMDKLGAFALTEPNHGSDSVALETSARPDGDGWVLTGRKRWIGLGSMADLVVVWARNTEDGQVDAAVLPADRPPGRGPADPHGGRAGQDAWIAASSWNRPSCPRACAARRCSWARLIRCRFHDEGSWSASGTKRPPASSRARPVPAVIERNGPLRPRGLPLVS